MDRVEWQGVTKRLIEWCNERGYGIRFRTHIKTTRNWNGKRRY